MRADPDNKATKSERDGTITGIFFVCLAISCILGLILYITLDEDKGMNPFICISACTCIALMLLMLCIGIAALQEVSAVVSIMLSNVRLN